MKIQKFISNYSDISSRKAEILIKEGKVKVNGETVFIPYQEIDENSKVIVNGKWIKKIAVYRYFMFNKPGLVLSSTVSQDNKKTLKPYMPKIPGIKSVGRLDFMSEGLMIFTNDSKLNNIISHPRYEIEKEYLVFSFKSINPMLIKSFMDGIYVENEMHRAIKASLISDKVAKIILGEGKNREIRKVFSHFKQPIAKLIRVRIGSLKLGKMNVGEVKEISENAVEQFYKKQKEIDNEK